MCQTETTHTDPSNQTEAKIHDIIFCIVSSHEIKLFDFASTAIYPSMIADTKTMSQEKLSPPLTMFFIFSVLVLV